MSDNWQKIPPGQVWLPVEDAETARTALLILLEHIRDFVGTPVDPEFDTV